MHLNRKAYVTLLSDVNYYDGVIVLKRSLQAVNAQYPLYCALSKSIPNFIENKLLNEGIKVLRLIDHIDISDHLTDNNNHWSKTFDKLLIWGFVQFEKIVFLDSDLLILNNIDSLFNYESFSGVCAGKSYPGNENWKGINSGVMVIVPDLNVKQALLDLIPKTIDECQKNHRLIGDQDVLQLYLTDRWDNELSLQIDEGYNIFADFLNYYIKELGYSWDKTKGRTIYVVHFIGRTKPWMKLSLRKHFWLLKNYITNPFYIDAYHKFKSYMHTL